MSSRALPHDVGTQPPIPPGAPAAKKTVQVLYAQLYEWSNPADDRAVSEPKIEITCVFHF